MVLAWKKGRSFRKGNPFRFQKGQSATGRPFQTSGNPSGRPKGIKNSAIVNLEAELAKEPVRIPLSLSDYTIDLDRNVVNGRRVAPRVAELTYAITQAGGWLATNDLISKLFGVCEPQDALTTLRGLAYEARKVGIPICGGKGRGANGYYLADERLWT